MHFSRFSFLCRWDWPGENSSRTAISRRAGSVTETPRFLLCIECSPKQVRAQRFRLIGSCSDLGSDCCWSARPCENLAARQCWARCLWCAKISKIRTENFENSITERPSRVWFRRQLIVGSYDKKKLLGNSPGAADKVGMRSNKFRSRLPIISIMKGFHCSSGYSMKRVWRRFFASPETLGTQRSIGSLRGFQWKIFTYEQQSIRKFYNINSATIRQIALNFWFRPKCLKC